MKMAAPGQGGGGQDQDENEPRSEDGSKGDRWVENRVRKERRTRDSVVSVVSIEFVRDFLRQERKQRIVEVSFPQH